jgi:hypothetical protein
MIEEFGWIAEQAATNVSRRGFLGRLGQAAAGTASVLGGLLLLPTESQGRGDGPCVRCYYTCPNGSWFYVERGHGCTKKVDGCGLSGKESCPGR